jgi:methionyl aminopeptidase
VAFQKTKKEISIMREGGALLSKALQAAIDAVKAGVTLKEIDAVALSTIRDGGGQPSFLGYTVRNAPPFPSTLCVSVNEEVVHGSGARKRRLNIGDLVGLDIGCWYQGLCTDVAATVPVGGFDRLPARQKELLLVTRESMMVGISAARVGGTVRNISQAIEDAVRPHGFGIIRSLVGHGVGHKVHENPVIPNYVSDVYPMVEIKDGACLAIEPMLTLGTFEVETAEDGWVVVTKDKSWGAHFELTIAVTGTGVEILTPPPNVGF